MSKVNIPKDNIDPFARYKRDVLETTIIKKETIVNNFSAVCKQIYREPEFVCQWLKKKLATSASVSKDGSCKVKGLFSSQTLDDIIEDVIVKHVICKTCGNPETVESKSSQKLRCKACGNTTKV